jgi:hypothetical protein
MWQLSLNYLRNLPLKQLALLIAAIACVACPAAWIWNVTHPVRINISRDEYEAALSQ